MKSKKPYPMARISLVYTIIALSPILFIAIGYVINIQRLVNVIMNLASLSMYFGLFTGIYSIFKIKREKLKGVEIAIMSTAICGLLFLIFLFSSLVNLN